MFLISHSWCEPETDNQLSVACDECTCAYIILLGMFAAKSWKNVPITFVMFVCPSLCLHMMTWEQQMNFHEIGYWYVDKIFQRISILLKIRHFSWVPVCVLCMEVTGWGILLLVFLRLLGYNGPWKPTSLEFPVTLETVWGIVHGDVISHTPPPCHGKVI